MLYKLRLIQAPRFICLCRWRFWVKVVSLTGSIVALFTSVISVSAQLQLLPDAQPQQVFSGTARSVSLVVTNSSTNIANAEVHARLYQASSATAVRVSDEPWKRLQVLPGQTIIESAVLDFPMIRAETRFVIQWINGTNEILGRTEALVYPPDLLSELNPLLGNRPLGVFDPQNQLKPLLKSMNIAITDLEDLGFESFEGKLAIIGPFASKEATREGLPNQIAGMSKKGVGVVWIQSPQIPTSKPVPSFYTVATNGQSTVVVQAPLVAKLADNPQSQLNLIHFARLARSSGPMGLPRLSNEP